MDAHALHAGLRFARFGVTADTVAPGFIRIADFDGARDAAAPTDRLRELRRRAHAFRERFADEPPLPCAASFDLLRVPYPAAYAFSGVWSQRLVKPLFIHLLARMQVIQFQDFEGQLKTLLFNPADWERGAETPYFKRLAARVPAFLRNTIAPPCATVPQVLARIGLDPAAVDYITYDHLHTQDLRRWLGGAGPALFPRARLLVQRQEITSAGGLLPLQRDWYCPDGIAGLPEDRVIAFDGSVQLGRGIALIHTPGHTEGNHSLVWRVPDGIRVSSENGVAADSWTPLASRHNAIRRYAQATGQEVVLNGNTLEGSVDQYLSMVVEKEIAGVAESGFSHVVPSSECSAHWLFPGAPRDGVWGCGGHGKLQKSGTQRPCATDVI